MKSKRVAVIGAGPAGLGTAYELLKNKADEDFILTIFEKNNIPGGLARTFKYKGAKFDLGPHRFYTKNSEVMGLWREVLSKDLAEVSRLTRILYRNKFFEYPIKVKDVIYNLGITETAEAMLSFLKAKVTLRSKKTKTFEDYITKNFGKKLYTIFFKTYTEKVWGIPCSQISSDWASQRIKNLNFVEVAKKALLGNYGQKAKSLVDKFHYPIDGTGSLYSKMADFVEDKGGEIKYRHPITTILHKNSKISKINNFKVDYLFSSMPLNLFVLAMRPLPPKQVIDAAKKLKFRDHITVNLLIKGTLFPDNWIYIHSPEVQMARVANYTNLSPKMVRRGTSSVSVEYFTFKDDKIWKLKDIEIKKLGIEELLKVGLLKKIKDVVGGFVIRETESYPTYYLGHKKYFNTVKNYVDKFSNLSLIGRGGMYKYNNMDHALYTGMLAARNFLAGRKKYDIWQVNESADYLEEIELRHEKSNK